MDRPKRPRRRWRRRIAWLVAVGVLAAGITWAVGAIRPGAPTVARGTLLIDKVRRGEMVRLVQGPGTLVPTNVRWITTETRARVERVRVQAGAEVTADTVLVELSNPDVQLRALEAERELAQAQARLTELEAGLDNQELAQTSAVETLDRELSVASRRAAATDKMHEEGAVSALEQVEAEGRAQVLESRLTFERKRLGALARSRRAQLVAQRAQIGRLQDLVDFGRRQVASLDVVAGMGGVVKELPLNPGQMVEPGGIIAVVIDPTRLKAELRVAETQAKDVAFGLGALIDTRNGQVKGRVTRIDPAAVQGSVRVDVALEGELPPGARPDLTVDGTIQIERLADVLYLGRPAFGEANSRISLFKLTAGGDEAVRVSVHLGKSSAKTIEVRSGLVAGDSVILSDLAQLDDVERIRLE